MGGTLFLFAYNSLPNGESMLLWKSDGTEVGTLPVRGFKTFCLPTPFMESVGGIAYFAACSGSFGHEQLWRSDGTPQGTFPITNLPTPPATPSPSPSPFVAFSELVPLDGALFFSTHNKLWRTTGLTETTVPIFDAAASQITAAGTKLFFAANSSGVGSELWVSDGTPGSATLVRDINPGSASSSPYRLVPSGDTIRFSADDGSHGRELWTSDGSEQGTFLLKDIRPGGQDSVPGYTPRLYNNYQLDRVEAIIWDVLPNGQMLFAAADGTHRSELWRSDGTPEGTVLVKDQLISIGNAFVDLPVPLGDILLFNASFQNKRGLWKSDGSAAGTTLITSSVELRESGVVISDTLFFVGDNTTSNGSGLWRSDGTPEGTTRIRVAAGWLDSQIATHNGAIFFLENGQLWRSDGTPQGTQALTTVGLARMTVADGALYLSATQGNQWTVWRSDGTAEGTVVVAQGSMETNGQPHHQPVGFIDLRGKTFFLAHSSVGAGHQPWPGWMPGLEHIRVELLDGGPPAVGFRFLLIGPVGHCTCTVSSYTAFERATTFRLSFPPLTGVNRCVMTPLEGGTYRIERSDSIDVPALLVALLAPQRARFEGIAAAFLDALVGEAMADA